MNDYQLDSTEMNRIFELLNEVLKIRITFFDLQFNEVKSLSSRDFSVFCRRLRKQESFNALCEECDRKNLELCKLKGDIHIYHCHAGLLEGMVPLYNRDGNYLGAIVFGQLRDKKTPLPEKYAAAAENLKPSTPEDMYKTGALLKYLSEYICENELIKRCSRPWTALLTEYIDNHLHETVTLREAARKVNRSVSFLAHNIPAEFGMTLKMYIRKKRMERAVKMLKAGKLVRECAFALGYKDEFYFSRDFKKYFGYAPKYLKNRTDDFPPPAPIE